MRSGRVSSIHIASAAKAPMQQVERVEAAPAVGLEGDRYALKQGTFYQPEPEFELTLIEAEAVEAANQKYELKLSPGEMRRNIVTRGVSINHLVGEEFVVGEVKALGIRLCEPCSHLQELTGQPVIKALRHRGGLRAQILSAGVIRAGDVISRQRAASDTNAVTFRELLRGRGAHVDPIASLEDVPGDVAGRTLPGYPHSIWQIVSHMNYWMNYELQRISGQPPAYPEHAIESWPSSVAPANDSQLQQAREQRAALLSLLDTLSQAPSEMLDAVTVLPNRAEAKPVSARTVLWQILAHNSYHMGQIALMLRSFGLWPPKQGGDTW